MKTKTIKFVGGALGLALVVATINGAISNDEQYLNSDPININGYVQPTPPTDAELETVKGELRIQKNAIVVNKEKKKAYNQLSDTTEELSEEMEEMIEERKESQVTIDKFNKKIDCLMATGPKSGCEKYQKTDKVSTSQASTTVETTVTNTNSGDNFGDTIKIIGLSGGSSIMSENEKIEAGIIATLKVETNVNARFSIGMGFSYQSLTTSDFGGNNNNNMSNNYQPYYSSYYGGREIEYMNTNIDIYSKFFIVKNKRFRPYIGTGLGYNRSTMQYTDNSSPNQCYRNQCYGYNFGDEELITSNVNVELMIGSEIKFTNTFGANIELNYTRGVGGNLTSQKSMNTYLAPDQARLDALSTELGEANVVSLLAGVIVEF